MMKLAILILLVGCAAASGLVSSQRAIIKHITPHGYGSGISSRFFDKAEYGLRSGIYGLGYRSGSLGAYGAGYLGGYGAGNLGVYGAGNLGGYGAGYLKGYRGNAYDGRDNLGLAYTNYDLRGTGLNLLY